MGAEDKEETQKQSGRPLMYSLRILFSIVLIALICGLAVIVWQVFQGGMEGFRFFKSMRATIIGAICLVSLIGYTIKYITSIPSAVRETEQENQERSDRYDAFLGEYFTSDKKVRGDMIHVLRLMDQKEYTSADNVCVKLLEKCSIPEEQAALLYCRMICREEMGYAREALDLGAKAVSLRKGYGPALLKTAQLCVKFNKMAAAEEYLLEAQRLNPQDRQLNQMLYYVLYHVYTAKNQNEEALEAAMKCEELLPHSADAAACVCRAAHKCGKTDIVNSRLQKCWDERYENYAALKKEVRGY